MNSLNQLFAVALLATTAINAADMSSLSLDAPRTTAGIIEHASERTLLHQGGRFTFIDGDQRHDIQPAYVDREIREIDGDILAKMLVAGNKLELKAIEGDEYALHLKGRLNGGFLGASAAVFAATHVTVMFVGQATGAVIALGATAVGGPAGAVAVETVWQAYVMPAVHVTANGMATAGAILALPTPTP